MGARAKRGMLIDVRVLAVGGAAVALGLGLLAAFLWMVPNAAAREIDAACRGLHGYEPVNPDLCVNGDCTVPMPAPDFTARDHTGKEVKLSDFRGKVVLLNFWASWCEVCKTEKPSLSEMAKDLGSDDFVVIALSSDNDWTKILTSLVSGLAPDSREKQIAMSVKKPTFEQALASYKQLLPEGIPFKVFIDPPIDDGNIGAITAAWGIKAVPESALIDRNGNIRAYFVNKRTWTSNAAQTCIRSVVDE
jgi:thiol-disulfide isomerase/thioredoxin